MIECNSNDNNETLTFNPFNPINVEITKKDVSNILENYGIFSNIHNLELYKRAFVHSSYTKRSQHENMSNNITIVPCPDDCMPLKTKSCKTGIFIIYW